MLVFKYAFVFVLSLILFISCDNSTDPKDRENNDIDDLEFTYLSSFGYSNLMPPNFEDPIGINITFSIKNLTNDKTIIIDSVEECSVYSVNNNLFGNINMYPFPEIIIPPSQIDTITFYKRRSETKLFDTPCGDSIYIIICLADKFGNSRELITPPFKYECDY